MRKTELCLFENLSSSNSKINVKFFHEFVIHQATISYSFVKIIVNNQDYCKLFDIGSNSA